MEVMEYLDLEAGVDKVVGFFDDFMAGLSGSARPRARRMGRIVVGVIFCLNIWIFYSNIRWVMKTPVQPAPGFPMEHVEEKPPPPAEPVGGYNIVLPRKDLIVEAPKPIHDPPPLPPPLQEQLAASKSFFRGDGEFGKRDPSRPNPDVYSERLPTIVTMVSTELMPAVRSLVGSIHFWHPEADILLYQIDSLTERHASEVDLWSNVELLPVLTALQYVIEDESLELAYGPVFELKRMLTAQRDAGLEATVLEPDLKDAFTKLKAVQPVVMWHAAYLRRNVFFLETFTYLSGWIDNVLKALKRDGQYFIQDQAVGGGCFANAQGYSFQSEGYLKLFPGRLSNTEHDEWISRVYGYKNTFLHTGVQLLREYLSCAVAAECPSAANLNAEEAGMSNWWGMPPEDLSGFVCHSSSQAKVAIDETYMPGMTDDTSSLSSLDGSAGIAKLGPDVLYDCRLLFTDKKAVVAMESQIKSESAVMQHVAQNEARRKGGGAEDRGGEDVGEGEGGGGEEGGDARPEPVHIALGIPTTTLGTQLAQPDALPLLNIFLPSFLGTLDKNSPKHRYTLYLGFELGDGVYDSKQKMERFKRRMVIMIGTYPVAIKVLRFGVSLSTTYVWNGLFTAAMEDGAQYFLACHDDTEFYPTAGRYWSDVLVESLVDNALHTNFGVAAPLDMRSPK
eukprot:gene11156-13181_t